MSTGGWDDNGRVAAGQLHNGQQAALSVDEGGDLTVVRPDDQISFEVAEYAAVGSGVGAIFYWPGITDLGSPLAFGAVPLVLSDRAPCS